MPTFNSNVNVGAAQGELGWGAASGGRTHGPLPWGGGQALRTHAHAYRKCVFFFLASVNTNKRSGPSNLIIFEIISWSYAPVNWCLLSFYYTVLTGQYHSPDEHLFSKKYFSQKRKIFHISKIESVSLADYISYPFKNAHLDTKV
jgi:hypothetical protein